jgi:hypothetical protein
MAKLLFESSFQVESLHENTPHGKQLYIEGIFAQANVKNGNGRMYSRSVMEQAVDSYNESYVKKRRALGELNHPDRPFADPAEAAILIESFEMQGDNVIGKAKVLNTPKGQIIKGLLEGGFNLGVSTRGLGSLVEKNGVKHVQNDFMLTAVDAVDMPSGPNCYVNSLYESTWVNKNGVWVHVNEQQNIQPIDESLALEWIEDFVKKLKGNK